MATLPDLSRRTWVRTLPERPDSEHLRKEAKRLAKEHEVRLAEAQRELAKSYGFEGTGRRFGRMSGASKRRGPFLLLPRRRAKATSRWSVGCSPKATSPTIRTSPRPVRCGRPAPRTPRALYGSRSPRSCSPPPVPAPERVCPASARSTPSRSAGQWRLLSCSIPHGAIEWEANARPISPRHRAPLAGGRPQGARRTARSPGDSRSRVSRRGRCNPRRLMRSGWLVVSTRTAPPHRPHPRARGAIASRLKRGAASTSSIRALSVPRQQSVLIETTPANTPEIARLMIARGPAQVTREISTSRSGS